MKFNISERLTMNRMKDEFLNAAWVGAGLLGASLLDRLVDKGVEKFFPSAAPHVSKIKAGVQVLAGVVVSALAEKENERQKLIGYGIAGSGFISTARLIPGVDQLFSGLGTTETPELGIIDLGTVGASNPNAQYAVESAPLVAVNLQDPQENIFQTGNTSKRNEVFELDETQYEELTAEML